MLMATLTATPVRTRHDDIFFSGMAILILGIVFLGFARSYYLQGVFGAHLPNLLIHVHGAVFSAWILLLIAQTSLISAGRVALHKRLGMFGAALAAAMVVLGFLAGTDALARGFVPPGYRLDPWTFYVNPFFNTLNFCVLIVAGLRARSDGPAHKRLILIATIALLGPAIGRWPFHFVKSPIVLLGSLDLLVLLLVAFDLWSRRRIHPATLKGGLFLMISLHLMHPIGRTSAWHYFATLMHGLWVTLR
jgi:hypothetical protein